MHPIFFSVKRVHLRIVEVSKVLLRQYELTPARFDLLRVVFHHGEHGVSQTKLCTLLGVSKTTVSRMLVALVEQGFVVREKWDHDPRNLIVTFTELGQEYFDKAQFALIDVGASERMAMRGVAFNRQIAGTRLRVLQRLLSSMRRIYGDPAPFVHPWRSDDLEPYYYTTLVNGRLHYGGDLAVPPVRYGNDDYDTNYGASRVAAS